MAIALRLIINAVVVNILYEVNVKVFLHMPWKYVRGLEVLFHSFLTSAPYGGGSAKPQAPAA
jgi:hypothetical protein